MLLRDNDITVSVQHQKQGTPYDCKVYRASDLLLACVVYEDQWDNPDNQLAKWLQKNELGHIWDRINDEIIDHIDRILANTTRVYDYGVKSGMDIYIGNDVFRLDKDGYISSKAFQIWYIATKKRIPVVSDPQWKEYVAVCLKMAEQREYDPLAPDLIDALILDIKEGAIHDSFCDMLALAVQSNGDNVYFVYRKDDGHTLWVPKHICTAIRQKMDVGAKKARQYWEPFLSERQEAKERIGLTIPYDKRPFQRFWVFSMEKLIEYDATLANILDSVIDCAKEHVNKGDEE